MYHENKVSIQRNLHYARYEAVAAESSDAIL
jgi:hypothetical protein